MSSILPSSAIIVLTSGHCVGESNFWASILCHGRLPRENKRIFRPFTQIWPWNSKRPTPVNLFVQETHFFLPSWKVPLFTFSLFSVLHTFPLPLYFLWRLACYSGIRPHVAYRNRRPVRTSVEGRFIYVTYRNSSWSMDKVRHDVILLAKIKKTVKRAILKYEPYWEHM